MTTFHGKEGEIKTIYAGHTAGVTDIKIIKTTVTHILHSIAKDLTLRIWDTNVTASFFENMTVIEWNMS